MEEVKAGGNVGILRAERVGWLRLPALVLVIRAADASRRSGLGGCGLRRRFSTGASLPLFGFAKMTCHRPSFAFQLSPNPVQANSDRNALPKPFRTPCMLVWSMDRHSD